MNKNYDINEFSKSFTFAIVKRFFFKSFLRKYKIEPKIITAIHHSNRVLKSLYKIIS